MYDNSFDPKDQKDGFMDDDDEIITGEPDLSDFDDLPFSDKDIEIGSLRAEIEELKKMVAKNQSRANSYGGGTEVALYNEISRLREDLAKTQNSQNIQMELGKIRDEMEFSTKRNDEKIHSLLEKVQGQIASMDESSKNRAKGTAGYSSPRPTAVMEFDDGGEGVGAICREILSTVSDRSGIILSKIEEINALFRGDYSGTVKPNEGVLSGIAEEMRALRTSIENNSRSFSDFEDLKKAQKELIGSINQISMDVRSFNEKGSINLTPILIDLDTISNKIADEDRAISEFSRGLNGAEKIDKVAESINTLLKNQSENALAERESIKQISESLSEKMDSLSAALTSSDSASGTEGNMILSEIVSLRDELQSYKDELTSFFAAGQKTDEANLPEAEVYADDYPVQQLEDSSAVLDGLTSIKSDIASLSDKLSAFSEKTEEREAAEQPLPSSFSPEELNSLIKGLYDKVEEVKREAVKEAPQPSAGATNELLSSLVREIKELKEEVSALKSERTASPAVPASEVRLATQDLAAIKDVKQQIVASQGEPDYVVMNEVLALRDEFQSMREQLAKAVGIAGEGASSEAVTEIKNLRDQIFAINMASVSSGDGDEQSYDSYNNLILTEIEGMRDDIDYLKKTVDEIAKTKVTAEGLPADGTDRIIGEISELYAETSKSSREQIIGAVNSLKDVSNGSASAAVAKDLAEIKETGTAQTELGMASLNLLTKIAKVIDEQNNYLAGLRTAENSADSAGDGDEVKVGDDDLEKSLRELKAELENMAGITETEIKKTGKKSPSKTSASSKNGKKKSTSKKKKSK